jgi:hypothetical protein
MSPPTPQRLAATPGRTRCVRMRDRSKSGGRLTRAALAVSMTIVCGSLPFAAFADTPAQPVYKIKLSVLDNPIDKPKTKPIYISQPAKQQSDPTLLPQTRYTVRRQIQSIEPISWLERYGEVQVKEK